MLFILLFENSRPVFHIKMFKVYHTSDPTAETVAFCSLKTYPVGVIIAVPDPEVAKGSDKPEFQGILQPCATLSNCELLSDLFSPLAHLSEE